VEADEPSGQPPLVVQGETEHLESLSLWRGDSCLGPPLCPPAKLGVGRAIGPSTGAKDSSMTSQLDPIGIQWGGGMCVCIYTWQ